MTSINNMAPALQAYIKTIEALESEKQDLAEEIKGHYAEAKAEGFDVKILRKVIAARKKNRQAFEEENKLFEAYYEASYIALAQQEGL